MYKDIINLNLSSPINTKTRKLFTTKKIHQQKTDIGRIYLTRKYERRSLIQLERFYITTIIGFQTYNQNNANVIMNLMEEYKNHFKNHRWFRKKQINTRENKTFQIKMIWSLTHQLKQLEDSLWYCSLCDGLGHLSESKL